MRAESANKGCREDGYVLNNGATVDNRSASLANRGMFAAAGCVVSHATRKKQQRTRSSHEASVQESANERCRQGKKGTSDSRATSWEDIARS